MIKKIRLYIIDRKIKKIYDKIDEIQDELIRIKNHMHDYPIVYSLDYMKALNVNLSTYNMTLQSLYDDKERLMK